MITEIFTGHAIDLHDVRAISGVMRESKIGTPFCYSTLYVTIHLKDEVIIRHDALKLQTFHGFDFEPQQKEQWENAFDSLTEQRNELVNLWKTTKTV